MHSCNNKGMARHLLYITNGFPGDLYTEKVFVELELEALRTRFDKIVLVPIENMPRRAGYADQLPDGVSVDWTIADNHTIHSRVLKLAGGIADPFVLQSLRLMAGEAHSAAQWSAGLFQAINTALIARLLSRILKHHGFTPDNTVLLSLWFHNAAAATALLAGKEGWKVAMHAHTSDIYDERMVFRSRRVRNRLLSSVGKVLTISTHGLEYLRNRFPTHADRFMLGRLGSKRLYSPLLTASRKRAEGDTVELLTIARLSPEKRLDMIMDVLAKCAAANPDKRVRWIVIGDGPLDEQLQQKKETLMVPNFEVIFEGMQPNEQIQKRLSVTPPDWLIMLSYSEGIPISMGEAMSYAIPVITTDVGSIGELADNDSALLLPRDLSADEFAERIAPLLFDCTRRDMMSEAALRQWQTNFDSTVLSERNADAISALLSKAPFHKKQRSLSATETCEPPRRTIRRNQSVDF